MLKRIVVIGAVILLVLSVSVYGAEAAGDPGIELNGVKIPAAAHIGDGNVYLPLRVVGEALGYKIAGSGNTIQVSGPGKSISIDLKNSKITADGHTYFMSGEYTGIVTGGGAAATSVTYMRADFFSDNLALGVSWDKQGGKVRLESIKENAVTIRTVKEASETDKIKITLQYPQLGGLSDKTVQDGINSVISKAAEAARSEGLKNTADYPQDPEGRIGSPNQYETYFDYRLKYNQSGLLSVILLNYQYTGGAHGYTVQSSHTFDLKTGKEYKLKDLVKSGADYVSLISGMVKSQIVERVKEGQLPEQPLTPFEAIREDQDFYLSDNGAVVYFQQYEYFPYAAGIQEFAADFSQLKDMLKPDFSFLYGGSGLPAIEVTENNRYIPKNGVSLPKAKALIADYLAKNGTKGDILSSMQLAEITVKEAWENAGVQLYHTEVDYAWLHGVAVVKDGKVLCVLDGMPTESAFLADLDGDGRYEIYSNIAFGSGMVSLEIRGYNIASDTKYSLSMRMEKDLQLFVRDGVLWVKESPALGRPVNEGSEPVSTGRLVLRDIDGKKELAVEDSDSDDASAPLYGSKAAYAAEDGLYCVNLEDGKKTLLVRVTGISEPVFSSDGKAIAFTRNGDLYAYDFSAAKAKLLLEAADSYCAGPDGVFYASSQKAGIAAVNPKTAKSSVLVPAEKDTSYINLKLSPDLKLLAYDLVVSGAANQDKGGTCLYDTATKQKRMILKAVNPDDKSLGERSVVAKWSPDSGKLLVWLSSWSASLAADGVGAAVYDVAAGKLTELEDGALAYDENVSFTGPDAFAMITGGGREMFRYKSLSLFDLGSGKSGKALEIPDIVPAEPCYSTDGKSLVFAASPAVKAEEDHQSQMAAISKRQIYMYKDGKPVLLTKDSGYRSEAPLFMKDSDYILFSRVKADGEKSLWIMDSGGNDLKLLAGWKYSSPEDSRATDFYGRVDWSRMFDVFDDTKKG